MREHTRRSLIIGAGLAAAAPKLVRAESIVDIPWNMRAAQQWATESFNENPGCRLKFADGSAHRWFNYHKLWRRTEENALTYAVAIEVCVTDADGRRTINTIPVEGYKLSRGADDRRAQEVALQMKRWNELGEVPF